MKSSVASINVEPINKLAQELIKWIRTRDRKVADFLVEAYTCKRSSVDLAMLERTVSFLTANSAIAAAVMASPGSSIISELLYDQEYTDSVIDQYFYSSPGGEAVKGRLIAMQEHLPVIMEKYIKEKGEVTVGSLGSGPGRYIINSILNLRLNLREKGYLNSIKAHCFDIDENAIRRGKRNASIYGVAEDVRFRRTDMQGNVVAYYHNKFDILVLKGILCPYENSGCRMVLDHAKVMLKPGGTIIASNVSKKMVQDDPFTCFIMNEIVNWVMIYKDENELKSMFEDTGLKWEGSFTDHLGFHIMGIGKRLV